jgi:hypothetical protein
MWHTPLGDRKLTGAEAQTVRASIASMIEGLEAEAEAEAAGRSESRLFDVPLFDNLSWQQKIVMLARVGEAILREEAPLPQLTAVNEAAVGAIYENLRQRVQSEVEADDSYIAKGQARTHWRRLALGAIREVEKPGTSEYQPPAVDCLDFEEWSLCMEVLEGYVLWDDDWRSGDLFMDVAPEIAQGPKAFLGIPDDYYAAIPPDPSDAELEESRDRVRKLLTT